MTKVRRPLTFERALYTIAGKIGMAEAARICGYAERTVLNWSDPDTTARIPLESALQLDKAYRAAGGDGAPMLQCYMTRLEADNAAPAAGVKAVAHAIALAAKEGGEAIAAAVRAACPGASDQDLRAAILELEESIAADTIALAAIGSMLAAGTRLASVS